MTETIKKTNSELSEADFVRIKQIKAAEHDRENRIKQATEIWNKAISDIRELRCQVNPMMVCTSQGNVFQFQILVQE